MFLRRNSDVPKKAYLRDAFPETPVIGRDAPRGDDIATNSKDVKAGDSKGGKKKRIYKGIFLTLLEYNMHPLKLRNYSPVSFSENAIQFVEYTLCNVQYKL